MQRWLSTLVVLIIIIALAPLPASAQQRLDINIGAATAANHTAAFVGVERGIFAKHGLNAKVIMYSTGVEEINGLLSGAQSVNLMGAIPFLAGISNGLPLVLIAHMDGDPLNDTYSIGQSVVAGPGSDLQHIIDLKGKRIGLPMGTGAQGYLAGLLVSNGLSGSNVKLVNIGPSDLLTAFARHDVDAISIWEPWPSAALATVPGSARLSSGGCASCYFPTAVLTSRFVVEHQPEQLRRFMAAFAKSEQWVRLNLDAAAEINMHWISGVTLPVMKDAIRQSSYDPRISKMAVQGFNAKTIPALIAIGALKKPVDPTSAIDASFILNVEKEHPECFSDLPPIPAALQPN